MLDIKSSNSDKKNPTPTKVNMVIPINKQTF